MEIIQPREQQRATINHLFSPDIGIAERIELDPGESAAVPILVTDALKRHDELVERESHRPTILGFTNVRSSLMQNAIFVDLHGRISDSNSSLTISNGSPNKAIFLESTKLCQTVQFKNEPLHGAELASRMLRKDIFATGQGNWKYMYTDDGKAIGLEFWVNPFLRFGLQQKDEPVLFNGISQSIHNRDFVNSNLVPIDSSDQQQFWVGELRSQLYLAKDTHLVISGVQTVSDKFGGKNSHDIAGHAPSILLKGGQTGKSIYEPNNIRVEIIGPSQGIGRVATVQMLAFSG